MGQEIYKDREAMQEMAIHFAKESGVNYNLILHSPVDGEFGDGSTYEVVTDSYFEKDRPHAILLTKTDDVIPQRANEGKKILVDEDFRKFDGFDEALTKLNEDTQEVFEITGRGTVGKGKSHSVRLDNENLSYMDFNAPELTDDFGRSLFRPRVRIEPFVRVGDKPSHNRNKPCPCESGKKFKKCCMNK